MIRKFNYDREGNRRVRPSDRRREARRRAERETTIVLPGSTPRLGPPVQRRPAKEATA